MGLQESGNAYQAVVEEAELGQEPPEPQTSWAGLGLEGETQPGLHGGPRSLGQDSSPPGKEGPLAGGTEQEGRTPCTVRVRAEGGGLQPDCTRATAVLSALAPVLTVISALRDEQPHKAPGSADLYPPSHLFAPQGAVSGLSLVPWSHVVSPATGGETSSGPAGR